MFNTTAHHQNQWLHSHIASPLVDNVIRCGNIIGQPICGEPHGKKRILRPDQAGKWNEHFNEIVQFKRIYNHCLVPHTFPENAELARWVKRQRYQYKLFQQAKPSSMNVQRIEKLEKIGFIWDSHKATWQKMFQELLEYKKEYGNCEVPTKFLPNPALATWVNRQRGQYKLYRDGKQSSMTLERFALLEGTGFTWEVRIIRSGKKSEKKSLKRKAVDREQPPKKITKKESIDSPKEATDMEPVHILKSLPVPLKTPDLFFDVVCDFPVDNTMEPLDITDLPANEFPLMGVESSRGEAQLSNREILRDVLCDMNFHEASDSDSDEHFLLEDTPSFGFDNF